MKLPAEKIARPTERRPSLAQLFAPVYFRAAIVGIVIGTMALATTGFFVMDLFDTAWSVPDVGIVGVRTVLMSDLANQARLLRTCQLFVDWGFTFFLIPIIAACAFVNLKNRAPQNPILECSREALMFTFALIAVVDVCGFIAGVIENTPRVYMSFHGFYHLLFKAWWYSVTVTAFTSPLVVLMSINIFVILVLKHFERRKLRGASVCTQVS